MSDPAELAATGTRAGDWVQIIRPGRLSVLPGQGGEQLFTAWLGHGRARAVAAEGLLGACDDMRVCLDLVGEADHPHDLPVAPEGGRVE